MLSSLVVVVRWRPVVVVQVNLFFFTSKLEVEIPVKIHSVAFRPLVLPPVLPPHSIVLLQKKSILINSNPKNTRNSFSYALPGVLVSIRVCHWQQIEVELVYVLVGLLGLAQLLDDVGGHGGGDPLAGVDAWGNPNEAKYIAVGYFLRNMLRLGVLR